MAEPQKIDRSQFRATPVAAVEQADKQLETLTGTGRKGSAEYLDIKEGTGDHNYRIYPAHPGDGGSLYAVAKAVHWIPKFVPKKDDKGNFIKALDAKGNPIQKDGKDELVREWRDGPVFNARIHGNQAKDIIEEYAAFAQKIACDTIFDSKDAVNNGKLHKLFLEPIEGSPRNFSPGSAKPKYNGIVPMRQTWVMYAHELIEIKEATGTKLAKKFGRMEVGKAIKDRLNKISASESSSEPLGTDPFTDLDDGRAIKIKYNKNAQKAQDYYSTEFYAPLIPGGGGKIQLFPISDEDLIAFNTQLSLHKMFVNIYDADVFHDVLKGLKQFDEKEEMGVFAHEAFLDIVDELLSKLPEGKGSNNVTEGEVFVQAQAGDEFDRMDRDELKEYNRENKLGIMPNKTMDDNAFRVLIRESIATKQPTSQVAQKEAPTSENLVETFANEDLGAPAEGESGTLPFTQATKEEEITGQKVKSSVTDRLAKLQAKEKKA